MTASLHSCVKSHIKLQAVATRKHLFKIFSNFLENPEEMFKIRKHTTDDSVPVHADLEPCQI